jgi:uncharacterized membrane protein
MAGGLILALMAGNAFITAYLISSYGALVAMLQEQMDELEAPKAPVPTG